MQPPKHNQVIQRKHNPCSPASHDPKVEKQAKIIRHNQTRRNQLIYTPKAKAPAKEPARGKTDTGELLSRHYSTLKLKHADNHVFFRSPKNKIALIIRLRA